MWRKLWSFIALMALQIGLAALPCGSSAQETSALKSWEKFDFSQRVIAPSQAGKLSLADLKRVRGILFGRHGRIFKEPDIQEYLEERPWYKPDTHFNNARLNDTERKDLDIIREAEARKHRYVEPGDLRFYQNRPFTPEQLGKHTLAELHIMRAEIEAIHGKRFDSEPLLQTYFEERYWYKPDPHYNPADLSETEQHNLAVLAAAEKRKRNLKLAPGDMQAFQNQRISQDMLNGLSLHELRLLRNEIYALHGQRFPKQWMRDYFEMQPWYKPLPPPQKPQLTPIEIRNVATILRREQELHAQLSAEPISPSVLNGLLLEDARNLRLEIYARHGKIFKTKWLQDYFSSLPWYTPNPDFRDSMLSATERKNIATIRAYEKKAQSMFDAVEG